MNTDHDDVYSVYRHIWAGARRSLYSPLKSIIKKHTAHLIILLLYLYIRSPRWDKAICINMIFIAVAENKIKMEAIL